MDQVNRGTMVAAVSAVVLFILMFFGWFGIPDTISTDFGDIDTSLGVGLAEEAGFDTSISAWQAFDIIDLILLVTIIAAIGTAVIAASGAASPVAASAITTGLGALSTVLVLYRVINPPSDLGREFWLFLGLIACAGIAAGGWMAMQEEGTTFGSAADQARDRFGGTGGGGAPPPPPPPSGTPPSAPPPAQ